MSVTPLLQVSLDPTLDWIARFGLVLVGLAVVLQVAAAVGRRLQEDARTPRGLRREARRAIRRGDHAGAAELLRRVGDDEEASQQFEAAELWDDAARLAAHVGHHRRAGALFERAKFFEEAADQYRRAGDLKRAEQNLTRAHKRILAAKLYEEAGELATAIQIYLELKKPQKAAELCERLGRYGEAAALYAEVYDLVASGSGRRRVGGDKSARDDLGDFVERVTRLYEKADDMGGLFEFLRKAGRFERAAELGVKVGRLDEAVELFVKAGREDRAALVYESSGQMIRAARLRGDLALKNQELHSAVRHYEHAGEVRLAAQVYEQLGNYQGAAEAYEKSGDPGQAAYFWSRVGRFDRAADLYDKSGNVDAAVRCYESTGEIEKAALLLERAGRSFEAGRAYMRLGRYDDGIRCLQDVPATSPSLPAAAGLLGVAFFEKGELRIARAKLEQALATGGAGALASPSADVHYSLGRVYEAAGEWERARGEYERVLALNFTFRDTADRLTLMNEALAGSPDMALARAGLGGAQLGGANPNADVPLLDEASPLSGARASSTSAGAGAGLGMDEIGSRGTEMVSPGRSLMNGAPSVSEHLSDELPAFAGEQPDGRTETRGGEALSMLDDLQPEPMVALQKRYEILEELGRGGMGVVYRCHDKLLDRLVAYKVLGTQIRNFPSAVASFVREAKSAARLNHPNIVTLYDFGESADGYYMTLEYVAGRNLRQFANKDRPDQEAMRGVLIGICNGLQYAHSQSVVHRDVKPSNVLVGSIDLKAKILDFGLAKVIERTGQSASGVLGTPWYMSPEQVLGTTTDHRTDLYSLGVTLFEIFTGQLPFKGRDFGYHHVHTLPPRADEVEPMIRRDLADIIEGCLKKNPDDRFANADDIRKVLHSCELYEPGLFEKRALARVKAGGPAGEA